MCGRYYIDTNWLDEIGNVVYTFDIDWKICTEQFQGDILPTNTAPIIEKTEHGLQLSLCKWGFPLQKGKNLVINARAETVLSKPSFRDSIRHCRCVIPAAGFYEWNKANERVSFTMPQSKILYMAGIWQPTAKDNQFTILTTSPNASVLPVHDRMPLVLMPEEVMPWIQDFGAAEKLLTKIPPLLEHKQEYEQLSLFTNSAGVSGGCDYDVDSERNG